MQDAVFTLYDMETWARRTHFPYYTNIIKPVNSMTVRLDVTHFMEEAKKRNLKFFPAFVCLTGHVVAQSKALCTNVDENGNPGWYSYLNPNYTIFHEDDESFSDLWSPYDEDFDTFYNNILADLETYKDKKGIKIKEGQPKNFFCISCVPWTSYDAYSTVNYGGQPNMFPLIAFGKYKKVHEKYQMPFTLTIAHSSADGYHICKFFEAMQEALDKF